MNDLQTWYLYGLLAFFSTFSVYNGQRLIKSSNPTKIPWLLWVQRNEKSLYLATFASGLLTLSCLLMIGKMTFASVLLLLISGVVSLLYVIPIKGMVMREIPYIKAYLIAGTWVVVLIVFPMVNEGKFTTLTLFHALAHALFFISVAIPFDIRDVKYDAASQKTIPQVMGIRCAKVISTVFLFTFIAMMLFVNEAIIANYGFYFAGFILFLLILFTTETRGDLYCGGAIDGSIGLIGLSYFLM